MYRKQIWKKACQGSSHRICCKKKASTKTTWTTFPEKGVSSCTCLWYLF